jgi:serine protease Do
MTNAAHLFQRARGPVLGLALSGSLLGLAVNGVGLAPSLVHASPPTGSDTPIGTATQLGLAFSEVAERVSPSVVSIRVEVKKAMPSFGFFFPFGGQGQGPDEGVQKGSGSGVIISPDGAVLTNNHVVENASRVEVQLQDGRHFVAKVVGTDAATDLAVLRIDAKGLPAARFADSDASQVGQWVVAIGSPFGLDYTVTAGVLSAKGRGGLGANEIEDYLQTDASINPGNSGGPLVNLRGEVLGINAMIIGHGSGIGFAIPSNLARKVSTDLLEKGDVSRGWIGVSYQELTPELASSFGVNRTRGALVNEVVPNGPAAQAGMRTGDIILDVQGREVKEGKDLLRVVLQNQVGAKLAVTVLRDGQKKTLNVVTTQRPDMNEAHSHGHAPKKGRGNAEPSEQGLALTALTPDVARRIDYAGTGGVVVMGVQPGSPADRAGMSRGDVIEEVNRKTVQTPKQVEDALSQGKTLLRLSRQGRTYFSVIGD